MADGPLVSPQRSEPPQRLGAGERMAHILKDRLEHGETIDADLIDKVGRYVDLPTPPITDEDRRWAMESALAHAKERETWPMPMRDLSVKEAIEIFGKEPPDSSCESAEPSGGPRDGA